MLMSLFRGILSRRGLLISLQHVRCYGEQGSLHVSLEPLDEEDEGVFQLTLTRPEAKNAIGKSKPSTPSLCCSITWDDYQLEDCTGRQLLRELVEALDMMGKEITTRCVIIRSGVPDVFCAGADLKARNHTHGAFGWENQAAGTPPRP